MVALNKDIEPDDTFFPDDGGNAGASSTVSPSRSTEISFVKDIVDTLQRPSPNVTEEYISIVSRAAASLGAFQEVYSRQTGVWSVWGESSYPEQGDRIVKNVASPEDSGTGLSASEKMRNIANSARNYVFQAVNVVNSFIVRARAAGYSPGPNPFVEMNKYNDGRIGFSSITITQEDASRLVATTREYLSLLKAEQNGEFDLSSGNLNVSQIVTARLSLDGFGGSGDTLLDLARLLPDADSVKAQKASEALSVFDFTKRVPKVVFTAGYSPSNDLLGVLVGWKRVPDAAGYVVRRRNIFTGEEVKIIVTNDDVKTMTERFSNYVKSWVTSFYDTITIDKISVFFDNRIVSDAYYIYNVTAYQLQNTSKHALFSVQTSPTYLTMNQKRQITEELKKIDPKNDGKAVSPYPVISHVVMGDAKYDWILAAVNTRNSIDRGDSKPSTRSYSYLAAQLDFLFAQSDAGKLVIPKGNDVSSVYQNISTAISKYGVTQVLKDVLSETGCLYYFEGKDAHDSFFSNVGADEESPLVSVVAAAIDPETATLDLKALSSNLPALIAGEIKPTNVLESKDAFNEAKGQKGKSVEVNIVSDKTTDVVAEDEIQFLSELGDTSTIVDLTTPDGVGVFVRTVRIFSDIGPNGGRPVVSEPPSVVEDPIRDPPPAPAPKSTKQPVQEPINEAAQTQTDLKKEAEANDVDTIRAEVKNNPSGKGRGDV